MGKMPITKHNLFCSSMIICRLTSQGPGERGTQLTESWGAKQWVVWDRGKGSGLFLGKNDS